MERALQVNDPALLWDYQHQTSFRAVGPVNRNSAELHVISLFLLTK
jgi:hypothetical protein